jgi:hypothetical protein
MNIKNIKPLLQISILLPLLGACISEDSGIIDPALLVIPDQPTSITLESPATSPNTVKQPIFKVEGVSPNQTVKLFTDSNCQTLVGSEVSTSTAVSITTSVLNFGNNNIYATVTNSDGGSSLCSTASATYRLIAKPSLSDIRDKVIDEDDELTIPFTASDADDLNFGCGSVRVTSSNPSLIPTSSISITGSGTSCSLKLTPLKDQSGEADITLLASDESGEVSDSLKLTVSSVIDPPSLVLSKLSLNFLEDAPGEEIVVSISDPDTLVECNQISFVPISIASVVISGSAPNCIATVTPLLNESGMGTVLFTVNNGLSASEYLSVIITSVPDAPQISLEKNSLTLLEDGAPESFKVTVFDPDSSVSCSQLSLSSSTLVSSVSGGVAPNCTLTISPKLNQHGMEDLTVSFKNDLEVTKSFNLIITSVDDPPAINLSATSLTFTEDDEAKPLTITLSDVDSSVGCSEVSVSGVVNLFETINISSSNSPCSFTLEPKIDTFGSGKLVFTVNNGKSSSNELTVTLSPVDDAPTISLQSPSLSFREDGPAQSVVVSISDKDSEINCSKLSVTSSENFVTIGAPALLPGGSASGLDCRIDVTPFPETSGKGLLTFTVDTGLSASLELSFDISTQEDAPTIEILTNDLFFQEDEAGKVVSLKIDDKDSSVSCSQVSVSPSSLFTVGAVSGVDKNCSVTLTPNKDKFGSANLAFIVNNGLEGKVTRQVIVEAIDDAPELSLLNKSLSFIEDGPAQQTQLTVSDIDSSVNCSHVTVSSSEIISTSVSGSTGPSCSISVIPKTNKEGSGELIVTLNNGKTVTEKISFTVTPNDDAPVITLDKSSLSFVEDGSTQSVFITISDVDSSVNCSQVSISSSSLVSSTAPTISGGGCSMSLSPKPNQHGEGSLGVSINNGKISSTQLNFSISSVIDPPVILLNKSILSFIEDGAPQVVIASISDVDVDSPVNCSHLKVSPNSLVSISSIIDSGSQCNVSIAPVLNANGSSTLTFELNNGVLTSTLLQFTISLEDDAPVATNTSVPLSEDIAGYVFLNYSDPENDKASLCTVTLGNNLIETESCKCDTNGFCRVGIKGALNFNGSTSFSYTVTTNGKISNSAAALVTITPVNDAPSISTISAQSTTAGVLKTITVNINDVDSNLSCLNLNFTSSNLTLVPISSITTGGTAPSCTFSISTNSTQSGEASIGVSISDGLIPTSTSFVLTVNPGSFSCVDLGYDGPVATVTSLTSCYYDCATKNLCGGVRYGDKNCSPGIFKEVKTCRMEEKCTLTKVGTKTVSYEFCSWYLINAYWALNFYVTGCNSTYSCAMVLQDNMMRDYGLTYRYGVEFYSCRGSTSLSCTYAKPWNKTCETRYREEDIMQDVCQMAETTDCTTTQVLNCN